MVLAPAFQEPLDYFNWNITAAIQDWSYQNTLLPTTKVNVVYVQNWDERYMEQDNYYLINSGGYSAAKVYDTISNKDVSSEMVNMLREHNILVVANVHLDNSESGASTTTENIVSMIQTLKRYKNTVFLAFMDNINIKQLYFGAAKYGLVGPNFVWISISDFLIFESDENKQELFNHTFDQLKQLGRGFVSFSPYYKQSPFSSYRFQSIYWKLVEAANHTSWKEILMGFAMDNGEQIYDCVKVMLIGLHQFLEDNPSLNPSDLTKPEVRKNLTISRFSKTGAEI
ncbi:hypothetical protein HDU97_001345 [Phlyctochytrium planicorne]|nr:hypothetical protein HDU97_001345 [Phlyctochytrium planicorne]